MPFTVEKTAAPRIEEWGLLPYDDALRRQRNMVRARVAGRIPDTLALLEHPPVYTLGRDGNSDHLRVPWESLPALGIAYRKTDRGGDMTYHGPGQLVGYLFCDLAARGGDVRKFVCSLEGGLMDLLAHFGIRAMRRAGCPGVYTEGGKIASIGIHLSRGVTSHGFALNVCCDLRPFDYIVPCGMPEVKMTSIQLELDRPVLLEEVCRQLPASFGKILQPVSDD